MAGSQNWQARILTERRERTKMAQGKEKTRRATAGQAKAMEQVLSALQPDTEGTAALDTCADEGLFIAGDLPDEEKEAACKVDFSILRNIPEMALVFPEESVRITEPDAVVDYAIGIGAAYSVIVEAFMLAIEQLGNAQELILNGRNTLFGRSTQRLAAVTGKRTGRRTPKNRTDAEAVSEAEKEEAEKPEPEESPAPKDAADNKNENPGRPRRTEGCADRACKDACENHIDVTVDKKTLDRIFGKNNWADIKGAETIAKKYRIIPPKVVVDVYHLHKYGALDAASAKGPEFITAKREESLLLSYSSSFL